MINKKTTSNGFKWSAVERITTQIIQLTVMLILGRLLGPKAFGLVGMISIFISISQTFVDGGFTNALIRKVDRTEIDYSTTFYINIAVSIICYVILFLISPIVSEFYNQPELILILRVLGLGVIINSFAIVQRARLNIALDFKTLAKASFFSVVFSALLAIISAFLNLGVWSLIIQSLSFIIFNVIFLNIFTPWWPKYKFSSSSFSELFGFGSKILVSSFIDNIYYNIYQIFIGKLFNVEQLGWFSQAKNLASMPAMTLSIIIQRVTFPLMSMIQDDLNIFKEKYIIILRLSSAIIFPLILGLGSIANPLINLVLGPEWIPSAKMMTLICIGFSVYSVNSINANLLQIKGRSDLFLKIEIYKKILTTIILLFSLPFGLIGICTGIMIDCYLSLFINTYYTKRFSGLSNCEQFNHLFRIWLLAVLSISISLIWYFIFENDLLQILFMIISSCFIYVLLIKQFQNDLYIKMKEFIVKEE